MALDTSKLSQAMATSPGLVSHHAAEKRDSKHHQLQCNHQQLQQRITVALGIAFVSCHAHSEGVQRCHQLQRNHHIVSRHLDTSRHLAGDPFRNFTILNTVTLGGYLDAGKFGYNEKTTYQSAGAATERPPVQILAMLFCF